MSSFSNKTSEELREALDRMLEEVAHEENRRWMRSYCDERLATGIGASMVGIEANALRSLCLFLGETRLEDVTKQDLLQYFGNPCAAAHDDAVGNAHCCLLARSKRRCT